ncbi:hypothetical protein QLR68_31170, partial [Micromonospora sp. DH15]|nr:hypothetical protein [Micromonospora sp. DH15]
MSRCTRVSPASSGPTRDGGRPVRLATAGRAASGPGCSPSSRNSRAESASNAGGQRGQPVRVGVPQFGGEGRQRRGGLPDGPRRHDGQRQRQAGAATDDLVPRRRLAVGAAPAEPAAQQFPRLGRREQVQRHRVGPVGDHQAGEPVAAGHHDEAARRARQQGAHLLVVAGVVEQHQDPPVGEQGPEQGGLPGQVGGHPLGRHVQRLQEAAQRLARRHRPAVEVEPAQVDVKLPGGVAVRDPARPVHRQGGLSD